MKRENSKKKSFYYSGLLLATTKFRINPFLLLFWSYISANKSTNYHFKPRTA